MVELATIDGARDLGIADKVGLARARQARRPDPGAHDRINMAPMGDPFEALVGLAQPGNVDTVVVDGRILRRGGRFTALDHAPVAREAAESAAALRSRANWP